MRLVLTFLSLTLVLLGCDSQPTAKKKTTRKPIVSILPRPTPTMSETETAIYTTNVAEEMVLKLTPKFSRLSAMFRGDANKIDVLLAPSIDYQGPTEYSFPAPESSLVEPDHPVARLKWPIADTSVSVSPESLWKPILDQHSITEAKVGVLDVHILPDADVIEMKTSLEGKFKAKDGRVGGLKSKQTLLWKPFDGDWKITGWKQKSISLNLAPRPLFIDVTKPAISDKAVQDSITLVVHRQQLRDVLEKGTGIIKGSDYETLPDWESSMCFSSVSVFDYDNDSFDDLLVLGRHAEPLLLRNNQKGGFEDLAEEAGLRNQKVRRFSVPANGTH